MKELGKNIIYVICIILAAYLITRFVGMRAVVDGESMEPTLQDGDNLIVEKLTYRFSKPDRYDIVIIPGAADDLDQSGRRKYYIKRVIGLPGETIGIEDGKVTIDGEVLESDSYGYDDYIEQDDERADMLYSGPYTLEDEEYFMMGDNRNNSVDSRDPMLGPLKKNELVGRVWVRIWPFSKFGSVQ